MKIDYILWGNEISTYFAAAEFLTEQEKECLPVIGKYYTTLGPQITHILLLDSWNKFYGQINFYIIAIITIQKLSLMVYLSLFFTNY